VGVMAYFCACAGVSTGEGVALGTRLGRYGAEDRGKASCALESSSPHGLVSVYAHTLHLRSHRYRWECPLRSSSRSIPDISLQRLSRPDLNVLGSGHIACPLPRCPAVRPSQPGARTATRVRGTAAAQPPCVTGVAPVARPACKTKRSRTLCTTPSHAAHRIPRLRREPRHRSVTSALRTLAPLTHAPQVSRS
jgi:hypothetical protein